MLKSDHWVIKAQSNANSHARLDIPSRYFVPVSPRRGKDYSFSSKFNLFSELVSVWFSRVLGSIISLSSVLLESVKPQGGVFASYRAWWLATQKQKHVLLRHPETESKPTRQKAALREEPRADGARVLGVRDALALLLCTNYTSDPKASVGLNIWAAQEQQVEDVLSPPLGSWICPPFLLLIVASWPHTLPPLCVNMYTTQAHGPCSGK